MKGEDRKKAEMHQLKSPAGFRRQSERLVIKVDEKLFRSLEHACCNEKDTDISVRSPADPLQAEMVNLRCAMGTVDGADVGWDEFGEVSAKCEVIEGRMIIEVPSRVLFEKIRTWVREDRDVAVELAGKPSPHQAEMVNLRCASSTLRGPLTSNLQAIAPDTGSEH